MATYSATITREKSVNSNDVEVEVSIDIQYTYYRACRGARDSCGGIRGAGPPLEPDEPASIEIDSVVEHDMGTDIELTDSETEKFTEEIMESLADAAQDYPEPEDR